jgi:hypothetical protein
MGDMDAHLDDPERRALVLEALRAVETAPTLLGGSEARWGSPRPKAGGGHLLTTARA